MVKTVNKKAKTSIRKPMREADSAYFLKIVLYMILGSLWVKFSDPLVIGNFVLNGFPFGLAVGLFFASHDHFQIDRKIELALLLMMAIITYFLPAGIVL